MAVAVACFMPVTAHAVDDINYDALESLLTTAYANGFNYDDYFWIYIPDDHYYGYSRFLWFDKALLETHIDTTNSRFTYRTSGSNRLLFISPGSNGTQFYCLTTYKTGASMPGFDMIASNTSLCKEGSTIYTNAEWLQKNTNKSLADVVFSEHLSPPDLTTGTQGRYDQLAQLDNCTMYVTYDLNGEHVEKEVFNLYGGAVDGMYTISNDIGEMLNSAGYLLSTADKIVFANRNGHITLDTPEGSTNVQLIIKPNADITYFSIYTSSSDANSTTATYTNNDIQKTYSNTQYEYVTINDETVKSMYSYFNAYEGTLSDVRFVFNAGDTQHIYLDNVNIGGSDFDKLVKDRYEDYKDFDIKDMLHFIDYSNPHGKVIVSDIFNINLLKEFVNTCFSDFYIKVALIIISISISSYIIFGKRE